MKLAVGLIGAGLATLVAVQAYGQPGGTPVVLPRGAGVELVEAHCSTCHGLDTVTGVPSGQGAKFWAANVARMIDTHGAEIPAEDAEQIVAYLGRTFG